jgi:predicted PurR-regulated permease PerM
LAVLIVVLLAAGTVAGFVVSAISPIQREINELVKQVPIWRNQISSGKGTIGHLAKQLHPSNYLGGKSTGSLAQDVATGALGAGEFLLGAVSDFLVVVVLGSTIAGVIVSLVALVVSLPVAISTAAFYIAFRFVEDYLLVPRVMRHAVNVSPVVTVLAVIVGAALLGIVGALVAIPIAAGIKLILEQTVFPRFDNS